MLPALPVAIPTLLSALFALVCLCSVLLDDRAGRA
jgi:hypothetical protein